MNEKFIRDLFRMVKLKCQECGQYYSEDDIEILKKEDGSCYLNIYCPVCNRRSFAIALLKQEDLKIDHIISFT
jgi:Zn finger protein HypA/HybF involved in hydrogenase expression